MGPPGPGPRATRAHDTVQARTVSANQVTVTQSLVSAPNRPRPSVTASRAVPGAAAARRKPVRHDRSRRAKKRRTGTNSKHGHGGAHGGYSTQGAAPWQPDLGETRPSRGRRRPRRRPRRFGGLGPGTACRASVGSRLAPLEPHALAYDKPLCASLDGFTLHAATRAGALDPAGREALVRYVLRPPVAQGAWSGVARAGSGLAPQHRVHAVRPRAAPRCTGTGSNTRRPALPLLMMGQKLPLAWTMK